MVARMSRKNSQPLSSYLMQHLNLTLWCIVVVVVGRDQQIQGMSGEFIFTKVISENKSFYIAYRQYLDEHVFKCFHT